MKNLANLKTGDLVIYRAARNWRKINDGHYYKTPNSYYLYDSSRSDPDRVSTRSAAGDGKLDDTERLATVIASYSLTVRVGLRNVIHSVGPYVDVMFMHETDMYATVDVQHRAPSSPRIRYPTDHGGRVSSQGRVRFTRFAYGIYEGGSVLERV